jgi:hypothetical protein
MSIRRRLPRPKRGLGTGDSCEYDGRCPHCRELGEACDAASNG